MRNEIMVAVYTHKIKEYCDKDFFNTLHKSIKKEQLLVIDNTDDEGEYRKRLEDILIKQKPMLNFRVDHVSTTRKKNFTEQFLTNVCESMGHIVDVFLSFTDYKYLLIIESDVFVPKNTISLFKKAIKKANKTGKWGIIGGLYYNGLHDPFLHDIKAKGLLETESCYSGCTIYNRELLEEVKFRWSKKDLRVFPDSWMSFDAIKKGFRIFNYHDIKCEHKRGGWV